MSPPPNWLASLAGDWVEFHRGVTYKKEEARDTPGPGFVPVLRAGNLQLGTISWDDLVYVPERCVRNTQFLQAGDVVVAMSSGSISVVGKAATVSTNDARRGASFGAFCGLWRPREATVSGWISAFFQSSEYRDAVSASALGVNINNLRSSHISELPLLVPPVNEQKRIVAKIEELTTRSRRAKQALEAVPPLLDKLRQSILAAAFRGDLTADWRAKNPNVEPASASLERMRAERSARRLKSPTEYENPEANLPDLPESWCWSTTAEVVHEGTIVTYGIVQPGPQVDDGVPYVRGQDIADGTVLRDQLKRMSPELAATKPHTVLQQGDVLLCIIRHLRVGIVPTGMDGANITQGAVRLRPSFMMSGSYLAEYLSAPFAQSWMLAKHFGLAMPRINVADARRVPVAVPPIAEQAVLVSMLQNILGPLRTIESAAASSTQQLTTLDASILAKAFRGDLVPQDPTDEPASVLLDRIRAARTTSPPATKRARPRAEPPTPAHASAPPPAPVKPARQQQLGLDLESAAIEAEIHAALWLHGPLDKDAAVRKLADHLRERGLVEFQRLRADGPLYTRLLAAIEAAAKAGQLDRPKRGLVRAFKSAATDYTPDDWRHALVSSLGPSDSGPVHQEDAIRQAAEWARDNLGLEFVRLPSNGHISEGLRSAINSGIRRGLIERDGPRRIKRSTGS